MTELGDRLKEARLAKDLSLDDLQSMTKIQKRYLSGIEEGNYSGMPGNFYIRAFIKQYAETLELNPEEIFETYKNDIPSSYNDDLQEQLSRVNTRKTISEGNSKFFDILPKILIGIFLIGAASLIYILLLHHYGSKPQDETINPENAPTKIVKPKDSAKDNQKDNTDKNSGDKGKDSGSTNPENSTPPPETTTQQELAVVGTSGYKTTYALKNADKFEVKLVSRGQSWVNIKNGDGKSYFQGLLSTNATSSKTVDFSSDSAADIIVGRAVDTDIYVNDQKLEYAIAPTDVVRQNITIQYVPKSK